MSPRWSSTGVPGGDLTLDEARELTRKFQVLRVKQRKKLYWEK